MMTHSERINECTKRCEKMKQEKCVLKGKTCQQEKRQFVIKFNVHRNEDEDEVNNNNEETTLMKNGKSSSPSVFILN